MNNVQLQGNPCYSGRTNSLPIRKLPFCYVGRIYYVSIIDSRNFVKYTFCSIRKTIGEWQFQWKCMIIHGRWKWIYYKIFNIGSLRKLMYIVIRILTLKIATYFLFSSPVSITENSTLFARDTKSVFSNIVLAYYYQNVHSNIFKLINTNSLILTQNEIRIIIVRYKFSRRDLLKINIEHDS